MKLLLTGFEPFGGSHLNPSEQVVRTLARDGVPGFVHLPALPEQVTDIDPSMPSMGLETMARGICAAIGALQAILVPGA